MAKSAAELETEIKLRWQSRKLAARGLWVTLRDVIESNGSKRPGHLLHEDGRPMRNEDVANLANTSLTTAEKLIGQLESKGLLSVASDGTIYSPLLVRVHNARQSAAARQQRHRSKPDSSEGALRNARGGVTYTPCHTDVTPDPPPKVSPSHTLPLPNPPPSTHTPGESEGESRGDDPIGERLRTFFAGHRSLIWSPVAENNLRRIVESSSGWEGMTRAVESAIAHGAAEPTSYALKVSAGRQAQNALRLSAPRPTMKAGARKF